MPTTATRTYTGHKLQPLYAPDQAFMIAINIIPSVQYNAGTILGEKFGTDSIQTLSIAGAPTGGTFTITWGGQTTAAIPYNAQASAVEAAVEALSNVGEGNVTATGGPLPSQPVVIEFTGTLGSATRTAITTTDSLTGGSSPASSIAQTRVGAAGTAGSYGSYDQTQTNGRQFARVILADDVSTDASGNITFTGTSGGTNSFGTTSKTAAAYVKGTFATTDLVGLDADAVAQLGGRLIQGTLSAGILEIP